MTVDENTAFDFDVEGSDPDGDTLQWSLGSSGDSTLFAIDSTTGRLTRATSGASFDHEDPEDADGDNVYGVEVVVSDGTDTATQSLSVEVVDVAEIPECRTAGTLAVDEDVTGLLDTFTPFVPEEDETFVDFTRFRVDSITETNAFAFDPATGELTATKPLDRESIGDVVIFTARANFTMSVISCELTLEIVDTPGRVVSGLRLEGYGQFEVDMVGDLDGGGVDDLFFYITNALDENNSTNNPFGAPYGLFVRGEELEAAIPASGDGIIDLSSVNPVEFAFSGSPPSRLRKLIAAPSVDVDGDGRDDLVLQFSGSYDSDREAGFVIWATTLDDMTRDAIDLTALTPQQGLAIRGQEVGFARIVTGDFDGDGAIDFAVSKPSVEDPTDPGLSVSRLYFATNSAIQKSLAGGILDIDDLDGGEGARLLYNTNPGLGTRLLALPSINGDAADELAFEGDGSSYILDGQFVADLIATATSGQAIAEREIDGDLFSDPASRWAGILTRLGRWRGSLPEELADVDGDGLDDIVTLDRIDATSQIATAVAFGNQIIVDGDIEEDEIPTAVYASADTDDHYATPFADITGDGQAEVLTYLNAPPRVDPTGMATGRIMLLDGEFLASLPPGGPGYDMSADSTAFQHVHIEGVDEVYDANGIGFQRLAPMSRLNDLDGDGLDELFIGRRTAGWGYVVWGSDLRDALVNGDDVDLNALLNVED